MRTFLTLLLGCLVGLLLPRAPQECKPVAGRVVVESIVQRDGALRCVYIKHTRGLARYIDHGPTSRP